MKIMKKKQHVQLILAIAFHAMNIAEGSNLANPSITLPEARIAVGASYHLGGYSLTNDEIPSLFNRFHGRIEYGIIRYITLGIDLGATQIEVDRYADTIPVFHGKYGFSGGAHLKLSSPLFAQQKLSLIAIAQATLFNSKNSHSAEYGGKDGAGIIGIQFHIPGFGFISAGPWVYLIQGENRDYSGRKRFYSNTDNIRGWFAIDFFPKTKEITETKPYATIEVSISPDVTGSRRIPFQALSVSFSIGSISKRLHGTELEEEWNP